MVGLWTTSDRCNTCEIDICEGVGEVSSRARDSLNLVQPVCMSVRVEPVNLDERDNLNCFTCNLASSSSSRPEATVDSHELHFGDNSGRAGNGK